MFATEKFLFFSTKLKAYVFKVQRPNKRMVVNFTYLWRMILNGSLAQAGPLTLALTPAIIAK